MCLAEYVEPVLSLQSKFSLTCTRVSDTQCVEKYLSYVSITYYSIINTWTVISNQILPWFSIKVNVVSDNKSVQNLGRLQLRNQNLIHALLPMKQLVNVNWVLWGPITGTCINFQHMKHFMKHIHLFHTNLCWSYLLKKNGDTT